MDGVISTNKKCTNTHSKGYHSDGTKKSITIYLLGIELLREASKKKIAYFETLSQLTLPSPPLGPIETFFNWDIFSHCWPLPPIFAIETYYFFKLNHYFSISQNWLKLRQFSIKTEGKSLKWDTNFGNSWVFDKLSVEFHT